MEKSFSWIGVDESGKGDYFGYLVIAGVVINKSAEEKLKNLNVRDSKKISDESIKRISKRIKSLIPFNVVKISPLKYNELHEKLMNINKILAWGHARVAENLMESHKVDLIIFDKFSAKEYIEKSIMKKGKDILRIEIVRGERDIGVAAASIIAREEFLSTLDRMSKKWRFNFPKGAGNIVDRAGLDFVKRFGFDALREVAKVHFKNTKKIINFIQSS